MYAYENKQHKTNNKLDDAHIPVARLIIYQHTTKIT